MATGKIDAEAVRKISIPKYFYEIIVPQMEGYYNDREVDFAIKPTAKCPLHGEDTPSFRWYEETNTFFCFGCRAGGDIINLHRKFTESVNGTEPSFQDAVGFLKSYFINGSDDTTIFADKQTESVVQKSTVTQMIVFSNYIQRLEGKLARDINMQSDKKQTIYAAIDETNLLASLNTINALDAMEYVKNIVSKTV